MDFTKVYTRVKLYEGSTVKLLETGGKYHVEECRGNYYDMSPIPNDYECDIKLGEEEVEIVTMYAV